MDFFLWLLAGHFIGDFAFQPAWMAEAKKTSWEVNGYHAATYTSAIMVVAAIGGFYLPKELIGLFFLSHFLIDPIKARWGIIRNIWVDQIAHLLIILIAVSLFK